MDRPYTPLTPGPWRTTYSDTRSAYTITSTTCFRQIAWIRGDSEENRLGEAEANAQLIANAPKLARVLEKIVDDYERFRPGSPRSDEVIDAWSRSVSMARSAILSAFGDEDEDALADLEQQAIAPAQTQTATSASWHARLIGRFRHHTSPSSVAIHGKAFYALCRRLVPPALAWVAAKSRPAGRLIARLSGPYGRRAASWLAGGVLRLWIEVGLWRVRRRCHPSPIREHLSVRCRRGLRKLGHTIIDGRRHVLPAARWLAQTLHRLLWAEASGNQREPAFVPHGAPLAGRAY